VGGAGVVGVLSSLGFSPQLTYSTHIQQHWGKSVTVDTAVFPQFWNGAVCWQLFGVVIMNENSLDSNFDVELTNELRNRLQYSDKRKLRMFSGLLQIDPLPSPDSRTCIHLLNRQSKISGFSNTYHLLTSLLQFNVMN